ncbi:MAG: GAF domain-containing protein [Anaerolineales bacterium]|nr:GAF domain-containing protein [Anaerolineales bacterium]
MLTDYRVRQREYLLEISRALTSQLDLSEVLRLILHSAVEILAGQAGIVALQHDRGGFRIRAAYGIPSKSLELFSPIMAEMPSLPGTDQAVFEELDRKMRRALKVSGLGMSQVVALPMIVRENLMGIVIIFRSGSSVFTPNDRQILRSFADQAAIAVNNAQLYEQVYHEKQRLNAILEYSADGVMILDNGFKILVFNLALSKMTGRESSDVIGKEHDRVIELSRLTTKMDLTHAASHGWPLPGSPPLYVEGDLIKPDDRILSVGITYAPLWSSDGHLLNIIANVRDITRFREAEEMKSTFISVISHELKTPVALIKGYAGTLRRKDAQWDEKTLDESLTVIEEESDRLNALINAILDASRLQSGALALEMGFVSLDRMAASLIEKYRTQTTIHTLSCDFPVDFPTVPGDRERLRQVLTNLLSNAIKYSPRGGHVKICGRIQPDKVIVFVQDEGIGVAPEDQDKLFKRFSRLDNALSRSTQGAGLGLFLVNAIIEAHGGQVWVESEINKGSTFYFSLPRD